MVRLLGPEEGGLAESQVYDVSGEGWLGLRADQSVMELWQLPV